MQILWPTVRTTTVLTCVLRAAHVAAGADPEILHGGWLSGWLPILYYTILNYGGWLTGNDRPTPIVLCTNKQVKGGWLATPSTPTPPPHQPLGCG